jgi:EAL domain-containing protein (putative c-di-GMP-specific phosphodiesterase class I)
MMTDIEAPARIGPPRAPLIGRKASALNGSAMHLPPRGLLPPGINEIRGAIDAAKLTVHYQPQIQISTGKIRAVEALIRWDDEDHGMLLPTAFLPLAVEAGMSASITDFVLDRLLSQLVLWRRFNFRFGGTLNVPAAVISAPDFVDTLHRKVCRIGIRPDDVTVEIPEAAATSDDIVVLENLMQLVLKGFGVAMDAFGTSDAALTKLERLPLTQLKMDRSLMLEAADRPKLRSALQAGLRLANQFGLNAVATGVERDEEWQLLSELGFDIAQGYLIAAPMSAEALPDWVIAWKRQMN